MLKALIPIVAAATLLAGCGANNDEENSMVGPTWQVVSLYLNPGDPDELPASAAGGARLVFGESSLVGNTGCAPLQAAATFSDGEETVPTIDATEMTIDNIDYLESEECAGGSVYVHESMQEMLSEGSTFEIDHLNDTEIVLTMDTEEVDSPSLRLMKQ